MAQIIEVRLDKVPSGFEIRVTGRTANGVRVRERRQLLLSAGREFRASTIVEAVQKVAQLDQILTTPLP